jgi:hypothetical protein
MLKKHIVLFQTANSEWLAYSTAGGDARRLVKNDTIFYAFECNLTREYPYIMKLKSPLPEHYDCKKITKYIDEPFEENEEYMIVTYSEEEEEGFIVDIYN